MFQFCKRLTDSARFQAFILGVIVLTAVVVGLETSPTLMRNYEALFLAFNSVVQAIFVVEIVLRILAHWPLIHRFFRDGWNVFDFLVIAGSLLPSVGVFATVARVARLFRVARLVSVAPDLRLIVDTMLRSIPAITNVVLLLVLLLYVYAILGYHTFSDVDPDRWGNLGASLMTLFKVLTQSWWADIHDTVEVTHAWAWLYFGSFIFIAVFVLINLFVAVIVENMQNARVERRAEEAEAMGDDDVRTLLAEMRGTLDRIESTLTRQTSTRAST